MASAYPSDADGDALARLATAGSNMSAPMVVEFIVAAPDASAAQSISHAVAALGYKGRIDHDGEADAWTVVASRTMIAEYCAIIETQAELDRLSKPHAGYADGWGSIGNVK